MIRTHHNLKSGCGKLWLTWAGFFAISLLTACSSTPDKPTPTALSEFKSQINVTPVWSAQVGAIGNTLNLNAASDRLGIVSQNGLVSVVNADTGTVA